MPDDVDPRLLASAVVVWSGWGRSSWPSRAESHVIETFGVKSAAALLLLIRELESDFYSSDAHLRIRDTTEMAETAAAGFRARHPGLPDDLVDALAWCYSWDYK